MPGSRGQESKMGKGEKARTRTRHVDELGSAMGQ